MKKYIALIAFISTTSATFAQPSEGRNKEAWREQAQERRAEVEKRKVAYLATELDLSIEEAQKFWPVYNEFNASRSALYAEVKEARKETRASDQKSLSAAELDAQMTERFARGRKMIDLEERYYEQFKQVLSTEKLQLFYDSEQQFRREMMRGLREQKREGPAEVPRGPARNQ